MHGWMEDAVCLLTDGCSPVGRELAVSLAKMDATVVIVAADAKEGAAALAEIQQRSCNRRVELRVTDLATRDEVTELAADFLCDHDRLDVLVNNAEIVAGQRALTVDGWEATLAINHLAPFLLTKLLLGQRKPSASPLRIVNVAAGSPAQQLDLHNLNSDRTFHSADAHAATKLMNVLFSSELARRTAGTNVTSNCVHLGAALPFFSSARTRSLGPLWLATSPLLEGVSGKYFVKMKEARSPDVALAQRLWTLTEQFVGQNAMPQPIAAELRFLAENPAFG